MENSEAGTSRNREDAEDFESQELEECLSEIRKLGNCENPMRDIWEIEKDPMRAEITERSRRWLKSQKIEKSRKL